MTANARRETGRCVPATSGCDASLISDLAEIILLDRSERLRSSDDRQISRVASAVSRFTETLSEHHRRHAEVLHRAFREVAPEFGAMIDELDFQHGSLRRSLERVLDEMGERNPRNALGVARGLLVELLTHLGKENAAEALIIHALSEEQLGRLPESVMGLLSRRGTDSGRRGDTEEVAEVA